MANNLFDNNEPYSLEAEQAVLGCLLIDPECLLRVVDVLKSECFYIPQHREIFSTILNLDALGQKFDALIVLEDLKSKGVYDDAGGKNYLAQLAQIVPSTANVMAYAKIVKEKYILRTLIDTAKNIENDAQSQEASADRILDSAEQKIYDIRQGRNVVGPTKISDIIFNEVYEDLRKKTSPDKEKYLGIPTGFSALDKLTTGFNKSDLVLIGARPAMGKTSFALNIARNMAVQGKRKVVFFSLEMSKEQLAQRVLSTEARVEGSKFRTGEIEQEEWNRIGEAAYALNDAELYFDDTSNITVPEMKARVRRMKNVDCVLIDYLQLMSGSKKTDNRVQEVSEITRSLKLMAKDLHIPVIACSQLNRSTDARGKAHVPQMSDLRESGSIEQDADIILMLYRPGYYENDGKNSNENTEVEVVNDNEAQVLVVKNRHGSTGKAELNWTKQFAMFSTKETIRDDG
ncbi:MAG TPA: replicative DNA helicase [Ruminococcaceae bacterium]|nr:replicative DNA helicase [Oscillospiraceae bacterium]